MKQKRPGLLPLVPFYWAAVTLKNAAYDRGWMRARRLARPVISVGSLSAGGAGKTPVVAMLGRMAAEYGMELDVLSRGYGRRSTAAEQVVGDDSSAAAHYGDEPVELARAGLRVFVGAERYYAGLLAEQQASSAGHLLDDGFQHRRLARDLELVLLTARDADDALLPAGDLREPLASLRRANVLIVREDEAERLRPLLAAHSAAEVWLIRRALHIGTRLVRPYLFCGIARPENFFAMVREAGYEASGSIAFPDHHVYTEADLERLIESAKASSADGFYLTRKDAVKLRPQWMKRLEALGPVHAPELRVSLLKEDAALRRLREVLRRG
jgi:tetraacyldisaccharide 4'-kinase